METYLTPPPNHDLASSGNLVAPVSRLIENITLTGRNSRNHFLHTACSISGRALGFIIFPATAMTELLVIRLPQLVISAGRQIHHPDDKAIRQRKEWYNERCQKLALGTVCSFLSLREPDAVSSFFLHSNPYKNHVRPYGVEEIFGLKVDQIYYPSNSEQVKAIIKKADEENKQISIISSGFSQGTQTVPIDEHQIVINTCLLNSINFSEDNSTVTVGPGAIWEDIQVAANLRGKSVESKQASNPFGAGGSCGINCHGWSHKWGAIVSTVASIKVVTADGEERTLTKEDELFGCMFGTLGYFGIITEVTLRLPNNEWLIQKGGEVGIDDFDKVYQEKIKNNPNIPLFGGRLVLDQVSGIPLRKVCMVTYEKDPEATGEPVISPNFVPEAETGTRWQRISLIAISLFDGWTARRLIRDFWNQERADMLKERKITRNEALHPPINAFKMLHHSNLHAEWLQEYFIKPENLPNFIDFLGATLKSHNVRLINATIRPTPEDKISILPYANKDLLYAVVLCFQQEKTDAAIKKTFNFIEAVNTFITRNGDVFYQAYMPLASREQFEKCYGLERVERMRDLKDKYDPNNRFGNAHTHKYYDRDPNKKKESSAE